MCVITLKERRERRDVLTIHGDNHLGSCMAQRCCGCSHRWLEIDVEASSEARVFLTKKLVLAEWISLTKWRWSKTARELIASSIVALGLRFQLISDSGISRIAFPLHRFLVEEHFSHEITIRLHPQQDMHCHDPATLLDSRSPSVMHSHWLENHRLPSGCGCSH